MRRTEREFITSPEMEAAPRRTGEIVLVEFPRKVQQTYEQINIARIRRELAEIARMDKMPMVPVIAAPTKV